MKKGKTGFKNRLRLWMGMKPTPKKALESGSADLSALAYYAPTGTTFRKGERRVQMTAEGNGPRYGVVVECLEVKTLSRVEDQALIERAKRSSGLDSIGVDIQGKTEVNASIVLLKMVSPIYPMESFPEWYFELGESSASLSFTL